MSRVSYLHFPGDGGFMVETSQPALRVEIRLFDVAGLSPPSSSGGLGGLQSGHLLDG